MPKEGQKNLTIQQWIWDLAVEYFEKHKEELKMEGITSPTGLITRFFLRAYQENKFERTKKEQ